MDVIYEVTVLFALAIALSFLIERFLEILKAFYDALDSKFDWYKFWTVRAFKVRDKLENKLKVVELLGKKKTATVLDKFREKLMNQSEGYDGNVPVISGDLVRVVTIRAVAKTIGIIVGIGLAFWMEVDFIKIWQESMSDSSLWTLEIKSPDLRVAISGVIIGVGSSPLHKVIISIDKKRKKRQAKKEQKSEV